MHKVDLYKLLEQHAVAISSELNGMNSEQWLIRVQVEDSDGRTLEQALRIVFTKD